MKINYKAVAVVGVLAVIGGVLFHFNDAIEQRQVDQSLDFAIKVVNKVDSANCVKIDADNNVVVTVESDELYAHIKRGIDETSSQFVLGNMHTCYKSMLNTFETGKDYIGGMEDMSMWTLVSKSSHPNLVIRYANKGGESIDLAMSREEIREAVKEKTYKYQREYLKNVIEEDKEVWKEIEDGVIVNIESIEMKGEKVEMKYRLKREIVDRKGTPAPYMEVHKMVMNVKSYDMEGLVAAIYNAGMTLVVEGEAPTRKLKSVEIDKKGLKKLYENRRAAQN
ncbi:MAG: hypothetical protein II951_13635 [Bacteroidales bacterium]|nr:hypothetical protein [Bacteroidales bacterium]